MFTMADAAILRLFNLIEWVKEMVSVELFKTRIQLVLGYVKSHNMNFRYIF